MAMTLSARGRARQARTIDDEILRMLSDSYPLQSLGEAELDLERNPVTRLPNAVRVSAWVRYGPHAVRVDGELCGFTANAAAIRWPVPKKGIDRAWVWRGGVQVLGHLRLPRE